MDGGRALARCPAVGEGAETLEVFMLGVVAVVVVLGRCEAYARSVPSAAVDLDA